jgi:hypothetical protein
MMEFIDGQVEEAIPITGGEALANFARLSMLISADIYNGYGDGYRFSSWVEQSDSRFGHVLLLAKAEYPIDLAEKKIQASLVTIDREQRVQVDEPKLFTIPAETNEERMGEYLEEISLKLSESEIILMLAMMKKSVIAQRVGQLLVIDGDIQMTLVEQNLDRLAEMFGNSTSPEDEQTGPTMSKLFESNEVKELLPETFKKSGYGVDTNLILKEGSKEYLLTVIESMEPELHDVLDGAKLVIAEKEVWQEVYEFDQGSEPNDDEIDVQLINEATILKILKLGRQVGHAELLMTLSHWFEQF